MSSSIWVHSGDKNHTVRVLLHGVCSGTAAEANVHSIGELRLTLEQTKGVGCWGSTVHAAGIEI